MRARNIPRPIVIERDKSHGPQFIAIGLAVLLAAAWLPAMPVVTSVAILAVGATSVTLARFRGTPALLPVMLLHAAAYGTLYAVFVGATFHTAATRPVPGLGVFAAADLAASTLPMAIVLVRTWSGLRLQLGPKR